MLDITTASVDQLTGKVLDLIDTYRYRPGHAALHVQFLLHELYLTQGIIQVRIIQPVLELWDKADTYCGNPIGEWGSAYVPAEYTWGWGREEAAKLQFEARQLVHDYLTELLDGGE